MLKSPRGIVHRALNEVVWGMTRKTGGIKGCGETNNHTAVLWKSLPSRQVGILAQLTFAVEPAAHRDNLPFTWRLFSSKNIK